jgi:hypothetical protein
MALQAVTAVKAHAVSDDGSQLALAFATREGGELSVMMPTDCLEEFIDGLNRAKATAVNKGFKNSDRIRVTVPKTWMVTMDSNTRGVVLVFDQKTDSRVGYGLDAESSRKIAAALAHNADVITKQRAAGGT